jgi:CheY-like chemotaxis protein
MEAGPTVAFPSRTVIQIANVGAATHRVMRIVTPALLITDDDRDFRETLRSAFEPRGFETYLAADGEEALEILKSRPVHLLLVDMYMPRLTGLETIRRLKQLSHPLPTILMSSALSPQIEQAAHDEHVFSVLPKPFSFSTIRDAVRDALQQTYSWAG